MKITKAFVGLAVVVALIAAFNVFSFGQSGNEPRVTQQIDDSNLVRLYRNTRPEANFKNDRGAVADTYDIDHIWLQLQRSSEQEQELDQYIDQLNDRTSPNFHKWLTPEEYGQFGVAKEDIDKVVGWLEYHGFRVNQIYPNNMLIDFSGTAGQIHDAFHTSIHNLEVNGEQHIANMSDPMIPAALRPVVHSIASLHDFKPHPSMKQKGNYTFGSGANTDFALTPQDTAVIYNVAPLWNAGTSGQGQTIYIIEDEDTYNGTTDWTTYRNKFGLTTAFPSATYTEVHPGGCTDPGIVTTDGADGEAALDVEVSSSMAPNAAIELVSCKDTVTFGGLIALQNLVNAGSATASASVVSISYGICEAFNGNGGNQSFYNTYQQAASEGYSVFVSTGDEGSSSCSADFSAGSEYDVASIGVTGWGETPYNVAVGGIDYEDEYNALEGGSAQSTYWSGAFTGSVTSGSKTITATTATFYSCDVGLPVSGTGIATGATISSVTSTTQATLSANASATESGKTFYLASGCNVVTGSVSSGSPTLTTSSAVLSNANIGNTVAGTGIPSGAVITSVSSSTSATLSASATANETGETITLTGYGSAKSYIPEIPWNDSCASVLLSYLETASATTYGTSGFCNSSTGKADFLSGGAGSGGGSNCAQGNGGTDQGADGISDPQCQGWPKPSYQSGSSLSGGSAVYGQPTDAVRDIPDVSMFAANGVWGHYEIVCWSDTAESAYGGASCAGAPSTWSGFGGTSVAAPMMAGIQALVNQKTGDNWGNPNPIYYQIAQSEYGTQGGTFAGTTCNSSASGGPASTCVFNDVTQGDMDTACEYNGTLEEAHCYKPSSTYGVDSTDTITAGTVIYGGSGYTTAPTCTIAGPTNNSPYKFNGTTQVWAGGTQATCTATISGNTTTTAVWSVTMYSTTGVGQTIVLTNPAGTTTCGPYTLSGASTTAMASGLVTSIGATGANCSSLVATATSSSNVVTITAKTAGAAGNFITQNGTGSTEQAFNVYISNTTLGQGPYYVSGITINTPGSGYAPETPITLTGVGTGAVAVANSSFGTAASSYQPTYGAAPGYDLATGLGTVNAYNLANSSAWGGASITCTSVPSSAAYNSNFTISCSDTDGIAVSYYASSGGCSNSGATYTMTSPSTSCVIKVAIAQGSPATTYTVTATKASQTITVTTAPPGTAAYNSTFPVAATASSGLAVAITTSGSCSGSGSGSATITMTSGAGTCSVIFNQSGNTYYSAAATVTDTASATTASSTTGVTSSLNPSIYGQSISFSATVTGSSPSGTVQFYIDSTAFGSAVTLASGSATSISTSTLAVGTHTVTATYSGDTNNSGSTGTLSSGQTIYTATAGTIGVTLT
ncbi:MAG: protease pro-enzyme activation domain-containing protein, partial [Terriglobales bacterium]